MVHKVINLKSSSGIIHSHLIVLDSCKLAQMHLWSLTHSLTCLLARSLAHTLTHSLTDSLARSLVRLLTHSLIHSLTHSGLVKCSTKTGYNYCVTSMLRVLMRKAFHNYYHYALALFSYNFSFDSCLFLTIAHQYTIQYVDIKC